MKENKMKIIIQGKLISIYKASDFTNKDTGEVTEGKNKLQLLIAEELANGSVKSDMKDISIPKDKFKEYEAQIGKDVQVECAFISKSPVNFYVK